MMIYFLIISIAAVSRFVPHIPNFAPITALAIFSAVYLPKKQAIVVPLAARFISDLFIGFFAWPLMLAVYASHLLGVLFGLWIKREKSSRWLKILASSLGASLLFFGITNFAFLYAQYPHNWSGIVQAYAAGLPFLRGTLLGDMAYTTALFGAYALAKNWAVQKQLAKKPL
jgi:hypothetical protein